MHHKLLKELIESINFQIVNVLFTAFIILLTINNNLAEAAKDGNLSTHSSGTVNIYITVNQSFKTVSPTELVLNETSVSKQKSNGSFCIAHHGFNQESSVPYKLVVDEIISNNTRNSISNQSLPFDIFLKDSQLKNNKQKLIGGMKLEKQSRLNINERSADECDSTGLTLSIKENSNNKKQNEQTNSAALLFLLVSPE